MVVVVVIVMELSPLPLLLLLLTPFHVVARDLDRLRAWRGRCPGESFSRAGRPPTIYE